LSNTYGEALDNNTLTSQSSSKDHIAGSIPETGTEIQVRLINNIAQESNVGVGPTNDTASQETENEVDDSISEEHDSTMDMSQNCKEILT
jgi:hypothetical protein